MSKEMNQNDDLGGLLDSFENEDVLYQKMDSFAKSKEEQKRAARLKRRQQPENEYTIKQEFIVPKDNDYTIEELPTFHTIQPDSKTIERLDVTRVFNQQASQNQSAQPAETVRFDDRKIQEMMGQNEEGPVLVKRTRQNPVKPEKSNALTIVLSTAAGVLIAAGIIFGFFYFVLPAMSSADTSSAQISELKEFANSYSSLSDKKKEEIVALETIFNRLSDDQKAKINEYFKEQTGFTFDELLAEAKSKDKENASNNNTQIAEKKAKIKQEIADLQAQVDEKQASLDKITAKINSAYEAYTEAQEAYQSAQSELAVAQNNYYAAASSYNTAVARQQELQTLSSEGTLTEEEQSELASLEEQIQTYLTALNETQVIYNNATSVSNQAYADLTNAQSEYESVQYSDSGLASDITALKKQIAVKQQELENLS